MSTNVDDIIERLRGRALTSEDARAVIAMVRSRTTADEVPTGDPLRDGAIQRFFTASEHEDVVALRDRIVDLRTELDRRVPAGRNKAVIRGTRRLRSLDGRTVVYEAVDRLRPAP